MAVAGTISVRVAELEQLDLAAICAPRELEAVAGQVASVLAWGHALQARIAQRASELAGDRRGPGPIEIVQRGAGMSAREARTVARRAEVTAVLPSFGVALADGRVSAEHVDTLGRAMLGLSDAKRAELVSFEAALVRSAESSTPDEWNRRVRWFVDDLDTAHTRNELERAQKLTRLRIWQEKGTGMVQLSGSIEPVAGERLWNALRRETNRLLDTNRDRPADQRLNDEQAAAHALVNLVAGGHAAQAGPNATDLIVVVGLERLTGEPDGQQVCETSRGTRLPVDWVRRLAHNANLIPLVIDQAGLTVELDRAARRRLAGFTQRVMLRAMHDTCMIGDCDVPFDDCEIHHVGNATLFCYHLLSSQR